MIQTFAVAHGQLTVPSASSPDGTGTVFNVDAPAYLHDVNGEGICYYWKPNIPATCAPNVRDTPSDLMGMSDSAANYPPLYYSLVGWPTHFFEGATSWYAIRVVSALLSSAVAAIGILALTGPFGRTGVFLATIVLTPAETSFFGTVNPQGLEIATAFTLVAIMLRLVNRPDSSSVWYLALGSSVAILANVRPISPLWAALIIVCLAMLVPAQRWKEFLRRRAFWLAVGLAAFGTILAAAWLRTAQPGKSLLGYPQPDMTLSDLAKYTATNAWYYWKGIVALFGWGDTAPPTWVSLVTGVALASTLIVAVVLGTVREKIAIISGLLSIPVTIVAVQYPMLDTAGVMWQGRYSAPLVNLVWLISIGVVLSHISRRSAVILSWLSLGVSVAINWATISRVVHRYAFGIGSPFLWNAIPSLSLAGMAFMLMAIIIGIAILIRQDFSPQNSYLEWSDDEQ